MFATAQEGYIADKHLSSFSHAFIFGADKHQKVKLGEMSFDTT